MLDWSGYFKKMKEKLYKSIVKLMDMAINVKQVHIYFNVYLLISMYFSAGIIQLNEAQEAEL